MTTMDANAYKAQGNEYFSAKKFNEAIESFTSAIELDGSNHVLYSNRSASYASLQQWPQALADAQKCVELNSSWAKGYIRLGAAFHGLRNHAEALKAYQAGLAIEPTNATLLESIAAVEKDQAAAKDPFAKMFGPDTLQKIAKNPKLAPFLAQPDYVQMINLVVANPRMVQSFFQDQRMMTTFLELSGIQLPAEGDLPKRPEPAPEQPAAAPQPRPTEAPKPASSTSKAAPAAAAPVTDAMKLKEEGNNFYKQRKFDEALEKYKAALALEPTNTTYLLNCTAVSFEKGEYEACATECEQALEHGRENRCDYTIIAKLMTRQALCLQRLNRHTEAIPLFKRALIEHRNPDTLAKLDACEKEKKKLDIEAYINPEIAAQKKEEGNAFFKEDKFPAAVEAYTEAIKRNPSEHTAYSNRAAAYLKLGAYTEALADAEKCLELKPDFVKAHARKGNAYFWMKQYNKALQSFDAGLKLDAANSECLEGKRRTQMKIHEMATGAGGEQDDDVARRAMADPEIAAIMQDSYMQLVLGEMQRDPSRIQDYLRDPNIAEKLNKLISSGIIRFGDSSQQQQQGGGAARRR